MMEILAPAGSPEALTAALRAGADAVYFGLGEFNARKHAANFDDGALPGAVAACHRQGVKAFVTLNTLVSDGELPRALEAAQRLAQAGVDGVIAADLGLAALLRQAAPSLRLHASTQCSVHSPAALPLLKQLGFVRVVPSREMSAAELKTFCAAAKALELEVEVFIHGALCMCVSGQCQLSALLGGRSGNRGLCAQPCRLPFRAPGGTGHDFSLKDLSLLSHLKELAEMGVASLKIEGRMKRPEYVAAATAAARQSLDTGRLEETLQEALTGVFSRSGFTDGYFTGQRGRDMFGIRTAEQEQLTKETLAGLHNLYRLERQCVPLTGSLTADGKRVTLTLSDGTHTVSAAGTALEAQKPMTAEFLQKQLAKLGGTPYYLAQIRLQLPEDCYLPAAALGALRRECVEQLDACRCRPVPHSFTLPKLTAEPAADARPFRFLLRLSDPAQLPDNLESDLAALPLECPLPPASANLYTVDIPRGMFGQEAKAAALLSQARQLGYTHALCGTLAAIQLAKEAGLLPVGDFGLNLFNSESLKTVQNLGLTAAVVSTELTTGQITALHTALPLGAVVYGRTPVMLTRNCPIHNGLSCRDCGRKQEITDRKGVAFPVRCRFGCAEILNSRPLWMADRLTELPGLSFGILTMTVETKAQTEDILADYRQCAAPTGAFTRGLFTRGVE